MKKNLWRLAAGSFLLFLLAIAVMADRGTLPVWIRNFYRFPGGDWVGHFVLYGGLAFLAARAFPQRVRMAGLAIPISVLVCILLAGLEELSQFWFPLRTPDWRDFAFGVLGILAGTWRALAQFWQTNKNSAS
jgi:VanZ family protein